MSRRQAIRVLACLGHGGMRMQKALVWFLGALKKHELLLFNVVHGSFRPGNPAFFGGPPKGLGKMLIVRDVILSQ